MANIIDYLVWRGDLPLADYPFNEVDNLILSELSYINWEDIVPAPGLGSVALKDAVKTYFVRNRRDNLSLGLIIPHAIFDLALATSQTPRFENIRLSAYVNEVQEDPPMQFSAMTVTGLAQDTAIVYRGTDDSLIGWWEDFNMSYQDSVPAQSRALEYLASQAAQHSDTQLIVCGHSKGGNLAVYAAANCPPDVQTRMKRVFNNDGPGFLRKPTHSEGYQRIRNRVHTILPQNSVVGILMEHEEAYKIVSSSVTGATQHDGMTWQVYGTEFVQVKDLTPYSRQTEQSLHSWLYSMTLEERKSIVEGMFTTLKNTGSMTLTDLNRNLPQTARALMNRIKTMNTADRDRATHIIRLFLRGQANSIGNSISALTQGLQNRP